MISRTAEDKKKLMEMPVAKDIRKEMEGLADKLEILAIEQQEYIDKITYHLALSFQKVFCLYLKLTYEKQPPHKFYL